MPEKKERFGQGILSMALANFDSWVHSPRTVLMLLFIIAICYLQMCGYKMTLNETGYTMHMGETLFYEFNFGCNTVYPVWVCECDYTESAKEELKTSERIQDNREQYYYKQLVINAQTGQIEPYLIEKQEPAYCPKIITWESLK